MTRHVVLNATAYDDGPSGARNRTIGLAGGLLRCGARVTLIVPRGRSLVDAVRREAETDLPAADRPLDEVLPASSGDRLRELPADLDPGRPLRRALASRRRLEGVVPRDADLFVTDYYPVLGTVRTALTVHDLRYIVAPEGEPAARVAWFRHAYPRTARSAPVVVVPTGAARAEVLEHLEVDPDRCRVVPNGLGRRWRDAAVGTGSDDRFVMIGAAERRKDLATAAAALESGGEARLLVLGRASAVTRAVLARHAALVETGRLIHHTDADTDAVIEAVRSARALVHPSRYEGFGMPLIEALAVGTPVLAAPCAAAVEVAAGHGTLVPAGDVDAWSAALRDTAALRDAQGRADAAAVAHARSFTWTRAAEALLAAID